MRKVNLRAYPKFWADLVYRIEMAYSTGYTVPVAMLKEHIRVWYGITVHVASSDDSGNVYMLDKDYTGFVLKWS